MPKKQLMFLAHVFKNGLLKIPRLAKNVLKVEEWTFIQEEEGKRGRWLCLSGASKVWMFSETPGVLHRAVL